MSDDLSDILGWQPDEDELRETARMLQEARPLPSPAFRGQLRRRLEAIGAPRPARGMRAKALGLGLAGVLLLALAGTGVAGSGPLAPTQVAAAPVSASPLR
ncbi:MAG: hypothetical protein ACYDA6_06460 [Solirubrobacteraceae bacterium]